MASLMKKSLIASMYLLVAAPTLAVGQGVGTLLPAAPPRPPPCQHRAGLSASEGGGDNNPNTSYLRGTKPEWGKPEVGDTGGKSVLAKVGLLRPRQLPKGVTAVRLGSGRLEAVPDPAASVTGIILRGESSGKEPVDVAICGEEPSPDDPRVVRYDIEEWDPIAQRWENPCVASDSVPNPKALAVSGVWNERGTHYNASNTFTFACETGAIAKCVVWGFAPWDNGGKPSSVDLHQACTRMVVADYCGNGVSHTHPGIMLKYAKRNGDGSSRTLAQAEGWDSARAVFEATWLENGVVCLGRPRLGSQAEEALNAILQECPQRLHKGRDVDLGGGDHCSVKTGRTNPTLGVVSSWSYPDKAESLAQLHDGPAL